ncbi:MAG: DUF924 family protein [Pseudomonadota bacterium]
MSANQKGTPLGDIARPEDVIRYWVDEVGEKGWYTADDGVDAEITARFATAWDAARAGGLGDWKCGPDRSLAYLLLTDQFPRNMFRDDPRAFATDRMARSATLRALRFQWDMRVPEPARQFFYLPLMHSEVLEDQEKSVRLVLTRMPETGTSTLLHARAHREVIRRFGRFPHRNAALGRATTQAEAAFLEAGSYGSVVRELQSKQAA